MRGAISIVECGGSVAEISRRQQIAATERLGGAPNEHAIHDYVATRWKIFGDKLMFRWNVREQQILGARQGYAFAFAQVRQGYESVVSRIEPQDAALCCSVS
jgi:hypothetical protein